MLLGFDRSNIFACLYTMLKKKINYIFRCFDTSTYLLCLQISSPTFFTLRAPWQSSMETNSINYTQNPIINSMYSHLKGNQTMVSWNPQIQTWLSLVSVQFACTIYIFKIIDYTGVIVIFKQVGGQHYGGLSNCMEEKLESCSLSRSDMTLDLEFTLGRPTTCKEITQKQEN